MQLPPNAFIEWYQSLKFVKANNGPANGSIATALVVLNRLIEDYDLDFNAHIAEGGMQIRGASGIAVASILKSFGEERPFAKEGGRTNRGGPAEVRSLLKALASLSLEKLSHEQRKDALISMQSFLVFRVREFHNRQKIKFPYDEQKTTWTAIHDLLIIADAEKKSGPVAQHLVGAKLQLRFPGIAISNESTSAADRPTQRHGDFLVGHTAFHVTVAPMSPVFQKCQDNLAQGLRPFLLVPDSKLLGARQNAEQTSLHRITVESIESFVSQNIEEISSFRKNTLANSLRNLLNIYNVRVDQAETDKSLMIELPTSLK